MEANHHRINHHIEPRIYSCRKCGYRMRYGTSRCSDCWTKAPIYNLRGFWRLISVLSVAAILTVSIFLAILLN